LSCACAAAANGLAVLGPWPLAIHAEQEDDQQQHALEQSAPDCDLGKPVLMADQIAQGQPQRAAE
jgi:hypothetical protein